MNVKNYPLSLNDIHIKLSEVFTQIINSKKCKHNFSEFYFPIQPENKNYPTYS